MRDDRSVSVSVWIWNSVSDVSEFQFAASQHHRGRIESGAELMSIANIIRRLIRVAKESGGSQIAEFAVCVPLLTVFAVGIFDFSGAFNLKQKLASAAQEGALVAASEPTTDLAYNQFLTPPASIQAVQKAIFLVLEDQNVLPAAVLGTASCGTGPTVTQTKLAWTYVVTGCPGTLTIIIDRGCTPGSLPLPNCPQGVAGEDVIYSHITVSYPYTWSFNNVIQLVGGSSTLPLTLSADAYAANQS